MEFQYYEKTQILLDQVYVKFQYGMMSTCRIIEKDGYYWLNDGHMTKATTVPLLPFSDFIGKEVTLEFTGGESVTGVIQSLCLPSSNHPDRYFVFCNWYQSQKHITIGWQNLNSLIFN